jgi:hypothetical protein
MNLTAQPPGSTSALIRLQVTFLVSFSNSAQGSLNANKAGSRMKCCQAQYCHLMTVGRQRLKHFPTGSKYPSIPDLA